jgi:alkylated DNA repair dioxygenase AlkB
MNLFEYEFDSEKNWLPKDGTVNYYGKLFNQEVADNYFSKLSQNIEWQNDKILIFGKHIVTKRKVAWYGDKQFKYTYSKIPKLALSWTKELLEIKSAIENKTGESFNSCLLNLYHNGEENMSWHSDDEKDLKKNSAIASLSLGAERKFTFKHKESKEKVVFVLEHGSLLLMKKETQSYWLHQLPKTKLIKPPRINLTFRTIIEN